MSRTLEEEVKYVLAKPYHWVLIHDDECNPKTTCCWGAYIEEFPGCHTCAETQEECFKMLQECAEIWVESMLERGNSIPDPILDWGGEDNFTRINCRVRHHRKDKLVGESITDEPQVPPDKILREDGKPCSQKPTPPPIETRAECETERVPMTEYNRSSLLNIANNFSKKVRQQILNIVNVHECERRR